MTERDAYDLMPTIREVVTTIALALHHTTEANTKASDLGDTLSEVALALHQRSYHSAYKLLASAKCRTEEIAASIQLDDGE